MERIKSSIIIATLFAISLVACPWARAEDQPQFKIQHLPPKPSVLPEPGEPLTLKASLKGTRVSDMRMRLLAVTDGQLLDVSVPSATFNDKDEPSYSFTIHAPLVETGYVFMLYDKQGSVVLSPQWYSVSRGCMPDISVAPDKIDPELQGAEKLKALVEQAQNLERDIQKYQKVLKILDEIKAERS